jgi:anti-sigma28 factor (negative regulator of flagellin synthesis)
MSEIQNLENARWVYQPPTNGGSASRRGAAGSAGLADRAVGVIDRVEISADGAQLAEAIRAPRASLRMSKVARIRAEIQNGTYDVDGKLKSILPRLMADVIASR